VPECGGERKPVAVVLAWLSLGGTEFSVMRLAPNKLLHWCYNDVTILSRDIITMMSHSFRVVLQWCFRGLT
jgi:hypothetical protein